jgi:hypothetical protein
MNTNYSFELLIGSSVLQHRDNPPRMTLTAWPVSRRGREW